MQTIVCVLAGASVAMGLALQPIPDGTPAWVNRNDVDWESCSKSQVLAQSDILTVALEEEDNNFVDHHALLYRCSTEDNPFYLRLTNQKGGTTFINLQWPSILDETYLFATTAEDKDQIGYGFRIMVSSDTKKRYHFRRFFFHTLTDMNRFIKSTSTMTNGVATILHKADFFKAPRYDISSVLPLNQASNEFGDKYFGNVDKDILQTADKADPTIHEDDAMEDRPYVQQLIGQYR